MQLLKYAGKIWWDKPSKLWHSTPDIKLKNIGNAALYGDARARPFMDDYQKRAMQRYHTYAVDGEFDSVEDMLDNVAAWLLQTKDSLSVYLPTNARAELTRPPWNINVDRHISGRVISNLVRNDPATDDAPDVPSALRADMLLSDMIRWNAYAEHREEQGEELFAKYIDRSLIWLRASGLSEMLGLSPRNDTLVNRSLTTSSVFDPFTVDSVPAGWFGDEDDVPSDSVRLGVILDPDFDEYQAGF